MKTIEEKAKAFAGKAMIECKQSDVPFDLTQSAALGMYVRDAYLAGASEALAGQWRRVEDETPEESEYVIIDGPNGIEAAVWNEHYQVWDDAEDDDFMYKKDAVKMWMRLPEPPKDESE